MNWGAGCSCPSQHSCCASTTSPLHETEFLEPEARDVGDNSVCRSPAAHEHSPPGERLAPLKLCQHHWQLQGAPISQLCVSSSTRTTQGHGCPGDSRVLPVGSSRAEVPRWAELTPARLPGLELHWQWAPLHVSREHQPRSGIISASPNQFLRCRSRARAPFQPALSWKERGSPRALLPAQGASLHVYFKG